MVIVQIYSLAFCFHGDEQWTVRTMNVKSGMETDHNHAYIRMYDVLFIGTKLQT
jgi:hypothetical protein